MELSRDVMNDLMVIYLSGEASNATQRLVEDYARAHADYAELLNQSLKVGLAGSPAPPADAELGALRKTKQFIFLRSLFFGMAIAFTLIPFTFVFRNGSLSFLLYRDVPGLGAGLWGVAAASWVACYVMHRAVRGAGL